MAVQQDDVRIQKPCPVSLDPARAANGVRGWHCGHCDKAVHVLSNMTETEARAFMVDNTGKDICVTYAVKKDGTIRFAPERVPVVAPAIVPLASLVRRRHATAAAVGLGLALAACAPHDNARIERQNITVIDSLAVPTPAVPVVPTQPPTPVPDPQEDDRMVDGEMAWEPPVEARPAGGLRAMPIADEPCDPPKKDDLPMRGGRRAMPIPHG
jgi:hypothetical protein